MNARRRLTGSGDAGGAIDSSSVSTASGEGEKHSTDGADHVTRPGLSLALIFVVSVLALSVVLYNCPELDE